MPSLSDWRLNDSESTSFVLCVMGVHLILSGFLTASLSFYSDQQAKQSLLRALATWSLLCGIACMSNMSASSTRKWPQLGVSPSSFIEGLIQATYGGLVPMLVICFPLLMVVAHSTASMVRKSSSALRMGPRFVPAIGVAWWLAKALLRWGTISGWAVFLSAFYVLFVMSGHWLFYHSRRKGHLMREFYALSLAALLACAWADVADYMHCTGWAGGVRLTHVMAAHTVVLLLAVFSMQIAAGYAIIRSDEAGVRVAQRACSLAEREVERVKSVSKEAMEQSRTRFMRYVFHEVRVPFNSLDMGLTLLADEESEHLTPSGLSTLDMMLKAAASMKVIINDTLDWSKIEAGMLQISLQPMRLRDAVQSTVLTMTGLAMDPDNNVRLESYVDPALPHWLLADKVRLQQIIANFVSNAVKFAPHDGSGVVTVTVHCIPEDALVRREEDGLCHLAGESASRLDADLRGVVWRLEDDNEAATGKRTLNRHASLARAAGKQWEQLRSFFTHRASTRDAFDSTGAIGQSEGMQKRLTSKLGSLLRTGSFFQPASAAVVPHPPARTPQSPVSAQAVQFQCTCKLAGCKGTMPAISLPKGAQSALIHLDHTLVEKNNSPRHGTSASTASDPACVGSNEPSLQARTCVVMLSVRDNGAGVSPGDASTLFSAYKQLDAGLQHKTKGTGLGLAICKEIIKMHGGSVGVRSKGIAGEGAEFVVCVRLPMLQGGYDDVTNSSSIKFARKERGQQGTAAHLSAPGFATGPALAVNMQAPSGSLPFNLPAQATHGAVRRTTWDPEEAGSTKVSSSRLLSGNPQETCISFDSRSRVADLGSPLALTASRGTVVAPTLHEEGPAGLVARQVSPSSIRGLPSAMATGITSGPTLVTDAGPSSCLLDPFHVESAMVGVHSPEASVLHRALSHRNTISMLERATNMRSACSSARLGSAEPSPSCNTSPSAVRARARACWGAQAAHTGAPGALVEAERSRNTTSTSSSRVQTYATEPTHMATLQVADEHVAQGSVCVVQEQEEELRRESNDKVTVDVAQAGAEAAALIAASSPSRPLRILVVDDVVDNRRLLKRCLQSKLVRAMAVGRECGKRWVSQGDAIDTSTVIVEDAADGHLAISAVTGVDAEEIIRCVRREGDAAGAGAAPMWPAQLQVDPQQLRSYDAITMDAEMPTMSGFDAVSLIRACGYYGPIFGCTGNALSEDQSLFKDRGVDQVYVKPVAVAELAEALLSRLEQLSP